jgi:UDPglucose 6-dehydrogenase
MENAKNILGDVTFCKDPYEVADGADCLAIITEWDEFQRLNLERIRQAMRTPVVVDGRNIFEKAIMERYGFIYRGIGR